MYKRRALTTCPAYADLDTSKRGHSNSPINSFFLITAFLVTATAVRRVLRTQESSPHDPTI